MIGEGRRRLFGRANTSTVKSSKRCPACSGRWGPMANKPNSISGLWTISVYDTRISYVLDPATTTIILLDGANRILPSFAESLSKKAADHLAKLGVQVITGAMVER